MIFVDRNRVILERVGPERPQSRIGAKLGAPLPANGPREHWMRAKLSFQGGSVTAQPYRDQDSSLVSVFAVSDGLLRRPAGAPASAVGDVVEVLPLARA